MVPYDVNTNQQVVTYDCAPWINSNKRKVLIINNEKPLRKEVQLIINALSQNGFDMTIVSQETFDGMSRNDIEIFHRILWVYSYDNFIWTDKFYESDIECKLRVFPLNPRKFMENKDNLLLDRLHEKTVIPYQALFQSTIRFGRINDTICALIEDDSFCRCLLTEGMDCRGSFFLQKSGVYPKID